MAFVVTLDKEISMAIILEDYEWIRDNYLDISSNGEYHIIPAGRTRQIIAFWRNKDVEPAGTIKFKVAGDEGVNPDEGTINLAEGQTTIVSEFMMYALDVIVTDLPSNCKIRLYFTEG